jgi:hypothetical protein
MPGQMAHINASINKLITKIKLNASWIVYISNLTFKEMKTINKNKSSFPRPFRFAIYLIVVTIVGFMNWVAISANDPERETTPNLETRLAEALVPLSDPEPELEDWLLSFSYTILKSRLDEALNPVDDLEPELEDWLLNFSDEIISGTDQ